MTGSTARQAAMAAVNSAAVASAGAEAAGAAFSGGRPGSGPGARALLLAPVTAVGRRIVMGVTMAFMLVIMI